MAAPQPGTVSGSYPAVTSMINNAARLAALQSYHILDTAEEKDFDDLTTLASVICQTPIALVSLVDRDRQWFKSHKGLSATETPIEYSFCAHAVASGNDAMIIGDASEDERFAYNPLVTGDPHIAFYAGVPLVNKEGFGLGSLCVIDRETRELSPEQVTALKVIAAQVMDKLELRRKLIQLEEVNLKLKESDDRFRSLVYKAPVAIAIYSGPNMIIEQANEQMLNLLGRSNDIVGLPLLTARPELEGHPYMDVLKQVFATGREHTGVGVKAPIHYYGAVKEGYFDVTYKPVQDDKGNVVSVMIVAADVTEKTLSRERELQANEELAAINEELSIANEELSTSQQYLLQANYNLSESESRFRHLIEQSPVAIATMNGREMIIDSVNALILKIWGKDKSVVGKPLQLALPELQGQPFLQILDDVYTTGKAYHGNEAKVTLEYGGELKDLFVNFVYQPIIDNNGDTRTVMVVANDVTEQVDARKAIEETNQRLNIALEASALGSTEVDLATGKMTCTEQFKKNYGRSRDEEFTYSQLFEAMLPQYRDDIRKRVAVAIAEKGIYEAEYEVKWPDGSIHWISAHGKARYDDEGKANRMVGMTADITEQVNARKKLEQAEEKFRLMADNISQLAWMADATGAIFWYNQRWFNYTDTTMDHMQGWGWQKVHHPDHVERVVEKIKRHFASGEVWEDTFPLKGADGEYRWFLSRAIPARDEQGHIISWFGTNTDVTEQRREQERRDDFLSIASHELKTPITSLKASLQLLNLMKEKPTSPMHIKLIEQANRSMEKMSTLVDDLLNVNSITGGHLQLNKTTFTVAHMLNACCHHVRVGGKHQLLLEGDEDLQITADEHRIEQIIVNFVNNVVKYAPDSKEIILNVEHVGSYAKISVRDTGPGISKEKLPYLFDRYYRATHAGITYTGLGLGLYISAEIVKKHGGQIGVNSELGAGSTFWFTLPL